MVFFISIYRVLNKLSEYVYFCIAKTYTFLLIFYKSQVPGRLKIVLIKLGWRFNRNCNIITLKLRFFFQRVGLKSNLMARMVWWVKVLQASQKVLVQTLLHAQLWLAIHIFTRFQMTFGLKYELKNAVINVSSKLVVGQPNIR